MMATDTTDLEFQNLLAELNTLILERDRALSSLDQVDKHLAALSTAIGLTSSAGLNTPAGLLCTLRPVTRLADVLGQNQSLGNYLFELTLHNDSPLSLIGNWNILVARLKPQLNSIVHVASLPQIEAGKAWTSTMSLDLSSFSSSSSSSMEDAIDLAVFLCFNGADTDKNRPCSSNIALLHVFKIDSLHSLQAGSGGSGTGSGSGIGRNTAITTSSYSAHSHQVMEIKLGVPKQFFGLDPEPQIVLDLLLKQGETSLQPPLAKQISNLEKKEGNFTSGGGFGFNGVGGRSVLVQRRQQKAMIQGELPQMHSFSASATSMITSSASTRKKNNAVLSVQPAPFSLAASSSPHAALDLTIEAGDVVNCLQLHKAVLQRVQFLQAAVHEMAGSSGDEGGIKLSTGVVVPPACSFSAILDSNEIEEISGKLGSLKEAAVRLQETVGGAVSEADGFVEDKIASELLELVRNTRNQTRNLVITL